MPLVFISKIKGFVDTVVAYCDNIVGIKTINSMYIYRLMKFIIFM
jgi:hypothetical protein